MKIGQVGLLLAVISIPVIFLLPLAFVQMKMDKTAMYMAMTGGFLMILAFICSLIGLFKPQKRGYAIAGFIISGFYLLLSLLGNMR